MVNTLNIELLEDGLDRVLKNIRCDLQSVLGRGYSKRQKDTVIYKTLGAVNTLWDMIQVTESDGTDDSEV